MNAPKREVTHPKDSSEEPMEQLATTSTSYTVKNELL